ncbi:LysR family transcriptional regulator [Nocardia amikacinitolerans]|uniref:LysR family transcriptional regulator n=1 Tax=Nocardia amikacinitolerans TaxID=756689 RepID=UPI0020A4EF04|nr:LysR family transcriptional regulator [Nocardia amikacinitolerans]MCP2288214.1 DNA-binding transcriptional regulator, LysR family [Nocardia amikacinitolerans]
MELRQLRYFLAVAEERNLTRAAEAIGIRPTSLSQQIIALERELGSALFVRSAGGMTPTRAGARLAEHARAVVDSARRARESVREERIPRVAMTPGAPPWSASALWRGIAEPTLEFLDMQTAEQLPGLREGSLDMGVLLLPADLSGLDHVVIAEAELGVVVSADRRLAQRNAVRWTDLDGSALLWFVRSAAPGYHDSIRDSWIRAGWRPTAIRTSAPRRALFAAELAHGGDVVALRPAWDVRPGDGLVWLPFAADAPSIRYALAWNPADSAATRRHRRVADLVRAERPHVPAVLPRGQRGPASASLEADRVAPR